MEDNDERLYVELLYSIVGNLKDKIKFEVHEIDYDNLELLIEKSNLEDIKSNDFSISFQKQNGSFTLITNKNLEVEKRKRINDLLKEVTGTDLFASYNFSDMQNINIDHFVYDDDKLAFNSDILKQFRSIGQIINLTMAKVNGSTKK